MNEFEPFSVVSMAQQVIDMDWELRRLRAENAELRDYRQKYLDELHGGIAHSAHMIGGLLQIAMKPGVMDAIRHANGVQP